VVIAFPIVVSAVVLFFASFLSWMVLKLHVTDWNRIAKEAELMAAVKQCDLPVGSYMFPRCENHAEMQTPEFQAKYAAGPRGVMTILAPTNMGQNLGLTFLYFLAVSAGLACLTFIAFPHGAAFHSIFGFVFLAAFMTFLAAMVQHAIWFRPRIVGHVIESVAYAALTAVIFAALWPSP
jgi:hypothetical protein